MFSLYYKEAVLPIFVDRNLPILHNQPYDLTMEEEDCLPLALEEGIPSIQIPVLLAVQSCQG